VLPPHLFSELINVQMNNDDFSAILLLSNFLHAPSITDIAPLTRVLQSSGYSSPAAYPQGGGGGYTYTMIHLCCIQKIIFYIILYYTYIQKLFIAEKIIIKILWKAQSRQSAKLLLQSSELGLPQPLTWRRLCPPPFGSGGRGTLAGERGGGRVPIPTRGHTLWYSIYVCTLWWKVSAKNPNTIKMLRYILILYIHAKARVTESEKHTVSRFIWPWQSWASKTSR